MRFVSRNSPGDCSKLLMLKEEGAVLLIYKSLRSESAVISRIAVACTAHLKVIIAWANQNEADMITKKGNGLQIRRQGRRFSDAEEERQFNASLSISYAIKVHVQLLGE